MFLVFILFSFFAATILTTTTTTTTAPAFRLRAFTTDPALSATANINTYRIYSFVEPFARITISCWLR